MCRTLQRHLHVLDGEILETILVLCHVGLRDFVQEGIDLELLDLGFGLHVLHLHGFPHGEHVQRVLILQDVLLDSRSSEGWWVHEASRDIRFDILDLIELLDGQLRQLGLVEFS